MLGVTASAKGAEPGADGSANLIFLTPHSSTPQGTGGAWAAGRQRLRRTRNSAQGTPAPPPPRRHLPPLGAPQHRVWRGVAASSAASDGLPMPDLVLVPVNRGDQDCVGAEDPVMHPRSAKTVNLKADLFCDCYSARSAKQQQYACMCLYGIDR